MHNWFECTIKYEKTAEEGKIVKANEKYLIDALSFTEAESRIIEEMKPFISGEFTVARINPKKVNELFESKSGDRWFKAKVNFITFDEEKVRDRKISSYMYVQANDIKEARENIENGMKGSLADYEVESLTETKIVDVFKYEAK